VWKKIISGSVVVLSVPDFYRVLTTDNSEIHFFYVSSDEIANLQTNIQLRIAHASPLDGIRQCRWALAKGPYVVDLHRKNFLSFLEISHVHFESLAFQVSATCLYRYTKSKRQRLCPAVTIMTTRLHLLFLHLCLFEHKQFSCSDQMILHWNQREAE
jgi:hypothetical protein